MKIAYLPLDDRPITYRDPELIARMGGATLVRPPPHWFSNPYRQGEHDLLHAWVEDAAVCDVLIVSIDALGYGGLVASRRSGDAFEDVVERLDSLKRLKARNPDLKILAYNVVMRISRHNSAEEEKPYWQDVGPQLFRISYLEHKVQSGQASLAEETELTGLLAAVPQAYYDDYQLGRARNHRVNQEMLLWLEEGVFDYLIFAQDDTGEYGWNIAEARRLQATIRTRKLADRAITYPGTDEVGTLLLASALCRQHDFKPKVFVRFSSPNSRHVVTSFEDRSMLELTKAHLAPLQGFLVDEPDKADLLLYINAPSIGQGKAHYQYVLSGQNAPSSMVDEQLEKAQLNALYQLARQEFESPQRNIEEFTKALFYDLGSGRRVALADVAYVNGADVFLSNALMSNPRVASLAAYGAWNTAGNTLGTVIAQACVGQLASTKAQLTAHFEHLMTRLLDDAYYQGELRSKCLYDLLPSLGIEPTSTYISDEVAQKCLTLISERLPPLFDELKSMFIAAGCVQNASYDDLYLPWKRLFEIGFTIRVEL